MDLALNNQQRLICHKTQTNNEMAISHSLGLQNRSLTTRCSLVLYTGPPHTHLFLRGVQKLWNAYSSEKADKN